MSLCAAKLTITKTDPNIYIYFQIKLQFGCCVWVLMLVSGHPYILFHGGDLLQVWEFPHP